MCDCMSQRVTLSICCVQDACAERTTAAGALDWKLTNSGKLDVDIYQSDKQAVTGQIIGSFKRIAKPIDRVVNVFVQEWLGMSDAEDGQVSAVVTCMLQSTLDLCA
jgi:hypothetical protein